MVRAYVLIQTAIGTGPEVAQHIDAIKWVISADDVTGPYDIIARAEARTLDDLMSVMRKIHRIEGVVRTLTCTVT